MLYIELDKFYANHRDFVKSRSFFQLRDKESTDNYKICDGAKTVEEIFDFDKSRYLSYDGKQLYAKSIARPCGLHAKAFFNDTIQIFDKEKEDYVNFNTTDISNEYDREYVFKKNNNSTNNDWIDVTDGNIFNFRKIYCLDANGNIS